MAHKREGRGPRVNLRLPELPGDEEIIRAVLAAPERDPRALRGVSASILADHLKVQGARRAGRGAVKGSWSGTMSASLRLSPRLGVYRDDERYRSVYYVTKDGRALVEEE
jgi:acyl-coenzyme A synthetase/AMP-(fatty) acid ligase